MSIEAAARQAREELGVQQLWAEQVAERRDVPERVRSAAMGCAKRCRDAIAELDAALAAIAAPAAEPAGCLLRRKRDGFVRGYYKWPRTDDELQCAELDDDEYIPYYTAAPAVPQTDDAKDAARYRWLKCVALEFNIKRQTVVVAEFIAPIAYGPDIDAAIDAAMTPSEKTKGEL